MKPTALASGLTVGGLMWAATIHGGVVGGLIAMGVAVMGLLLGAALFGGAK